MRKEVFDVSDKTLYLLLIRLTDGEHPEMYVIPAYAWNDKSKTALVYHGYEGKKSDSEYGVNVSKKNLPQLDCYKIENCIEKLVK